MVYLIEMESQGVCKIGRSANPLKRLSSLQVASPHNLLLVGMIQGDVEKEAELHGLFDGQRVKGEWFRTSNELTSLFTPLGEVELTSQERHDSRPNRGFTYLLALNYEGDVVGHKDITAQSNATIEKSIRSLCEEAGSNSLVFCTEDSPVPRTQFEHGDAFRCPYPNHSYLGNQPHDE